MTPAEPCKFRSLISSFRPHRDSVKTIFQRGLNIVLVRIDQCACSDRGLDQWSNCLLLDVLQHADDDAAASLNHAQHRRLFLLQRTPAARPS